VEFTCTKCNKKFGPGQWHCFPGEPHEVEQKTYYIGTSLKDISDRVKSRVRVFVTPDTEVTDSAGQKHVTHARSIEFVGGAFSTSNPEDQFFFASKYQKSLIDSKAWQEQYIHPGELLAMKERDLENRKKRIENEENALLAREKAVREAEAKKGK
jgi:hypothetical protein